MKQIVLNIISMMRIKTKNKNKYTRFSESNVANKKTSEA